MKHSGGISYLLLPFNLFATSYFQVLMRPNTSLAASLARGAVISGGMILLLPSLLGPESIWWAMPVTEVLVALFSLFFMVRYTKQLSNH